MTASLEDGLASLAVEKWRLLRLLDRVVDLLPNDNRQRIKAQTRFAAARLESILGESGLSLETFEGRPFEPNLPVTAVNADDFPPGTRLSVADTVQPTVMRQGRVILLGTVTVSEQGDNDVPGN